MSMELFIKENRYPNLLKFSTQQPAMGKKYIKHFDTEQDATKNLQNKMKVAFHTVRGEKKRGPDLLVNLNSLFAVAKTEDALVSGDNSKPDNMEVDTEITNLAMLEENLDDYILEKGFNVSLHFRRFKSEPEKKSREKGFYIDGNLHQILSLSHVLLLKTNEHDESLVEAFGLDNLKEVHEDLLEKYIEKNLAMETTTFNLLISALRELTEKSKEDQ